MLGLLPAGLRALHNKLWTTLLFYVCVCVDLTQQVLHALGGLDHLGADSRAADAVQGVVGFGDDLKGQHTHTRMSRRCAHTHTHTHQQ